MVVPAEVSAARLAVIIPMYNEETNAEKCVRVVCAVLQRHLPGSKLFVVNDGSQDRTGGILEELSHEKKPLVYINQLTNRGYGAALLTGAKHAFEAGYTHGLFMDSDLTNDPALIPSFAEKLSEGDYDLIKASRFIQGGGMHGVPFFRQMISVWGNWVASRLFRMGIKDCTNGFRAVRLAMICSTRFRENGFPIIAEELLYLKKQGARATEIPSVLTARTSDEEGSSFVYSRQVLFAYLKYALLAALVKNSRRDPRK